jgi:hypothetical protein
MFNRLESSMSDVCWLGRLAWARLPGLGEAGCLGRNRLAGAWGLGDAGCLGEAGSFDRGRLAEAMPAG